MTEVVESLAAIFQRHAAPAEPKGTGEEMNTMQNVADVAAAQAGTGTGSVALPIVDPAMPVQTIVTVPATNSKFSAGAHTLFAAGTLATAMQVEQLAVGVFEDYHVTVGTNTQLALVFLIACAIHWLVLKKILPATLEGDTQ